MSTRDGGLECEVTYRSPCNYIRLRNIAYRILVRKPEGKRPLGRPKRRLVDNIKMDLREIGWD
jgi:hypothetical protein